MPSFTVTVARIGESEHKDPEEEFTKVTSVRTDDEGHLRIEMEGGRGASFGPTTWGAFKVIATPSAATRI